MHYQVFVPKSGELWPTLADVGLADHAPNAHHVDLLGGLPQTEHTQPGRLFSWPTPAQPQNNYLPGSVWIPAAADPYRKFAAGRYVVGIRRDNPPLPSELERPRQFAGQSVLLGDGHDWHIPAAALLPRRFRLQADGRHVTEIRAEFQAFWEASQRWYQWCLQQAGSEAFTDDDYWSYAYSALSLNYRLTPEVEDYLGLIDTEHVFGLILATVAGQQIREVEESQKKTTPAAIPAG